MSFSKSNSGAIDSDECSDSAVLASFLAQKQSQHRQIDQKRIDFGDSEGTVPLQELGSSQSFTPVSADQMNEVNISKTSRLALP